MHATADVGSTLDDEGIDPMPDSVVCGTESTDTAPDDDMWILSVAHGYS
jgi:hypothetical protein